jgi:hypothetical protein
MLKSFATKLGVKFRGRAADISWRHSPSKFGAQFAARFNTQFGTKKDYKFGTQESHYKFGGEELPLPQICYFSVAWATCKIPSSE